MSVDSELAFVLMERLRPRERPFVMVLVAAEEFDVERDMSDCSRTKPRP
jgi:hypothetical protein